MKDGSKYYVNVPLRQIVYGHCLLVVRADSPDGAREKAAISVGGGDLLGVLFKKDGEGAPFGDPEKMQEWKVEKVGETGGLNRYWTWEEIARIIEEYLAELGGIYGGYSIQNSEGEECPVDEAAYIQFLPDGVKHPIALILSM